MRVDDLSALLNVSAVTIRSDLSYLEDQGLIVRRFGKAMALEALAPRSGGPSEPSDHRFTADMLRAARELVSPDAPILIGHGVLPVRLIPLFSEIAGLSLILSSWDAVVVARSCLDCDINVLGGRLGADGSSLQGPKAIQSLSADLIGTFVFEARAVTAEGGLLMLDPATEQFCAAACRQAARTIALVPSAALLLARAGFQLPLDLVDHVILPSSPDMGCREQLIRAGYQPGGMTASVFGREHAITRGNAHVSAS